MTLPTLSAVGLLLLLPFFTLIGYGVVRWFMVPTIVDFAKAIRTRKVDNPEDFVFNLCTFLAIVGMILFYVGF